MGAGRRLLALLVPLALDLLVAWLALVHIPGTYSVALTRILESVPDVGLLAMVTIAIALLWGTIRTVLMLAVWRRARGGPEPSAVPAAA